MLGNFDVFLLLGVDGGGDGNLVNFRRLISMWQNYVLINFNEISDIFDNF